MCFFDLGTTISEGDTRWACRCAATFARIEPFLAFAAKPFMTFAGEVFGANMDVYAEMSFEDGSGS